METHARPVCPKCHLPIEEGEPSIVHEGKRYHRRCAPAPASAGDKEVKFEDPFSGVGPS